MPPQPAALPSASLSSAAKPAAPASHGPAVPRMATVTGTGRFGLSIRKSPGTSAERIATVPEGFQAHVTAGPVSQDGVEWYQLQGQDVSGWASGAYLNIANASASQPAAPLSSASAAPASASAGLASASAAPAIPSPLVSPFSGILSQLNRESNYNVSGSGIFVEGPLKPGVDHLAASPTAEALLLKTAPVYVRITVAHFPATTEGGEFSTLGHSIKVADTIVQESIDVQASVLAHELQHASDILVDHAAPETAQDCVNLELHAFHSEEKVWLELTKPSPPQTRMERELDGLSHVVDTPGFAQQLAKLYAGECGSYGGQTTQS